ncbi:MAG TPA: DUF6290 family protein [Vicinamibacteria bacterium]|nr:DUF6290 family protein [Vicinamibacteria bacterium]
MDTITNRIDEDLKKLLDRYCEEHGLEARAVVQEAIAQWLEDAEDLTLIEERRRGPWVEWEVYRRILDRR